MKVYTVCVITGEISIIDDKSLFDEINFTGTERLHLEIAGLDRDSEPVMQKIFYYGRNQTRVKSK